MTPPPFDISAALAGPVTAAITIATAYLMTIDWTHPNPDQEQP